MASVDPDTSMALAGQEDLPLWPYVMNQMFCALVSLGAASTNLLNTEAGAAWEVYLIWLGMMLASGLAQAAVRVRS